jgi:hypothetical protein
VYWGADARKDLLVGLSDGRVKLYTNAGTDEEPTYDGGVFLRVGPFGGKADIDVGARATPTAVDWNDDGMKDLAIGAYDGRIHLFLNTGSDTLPDFQSETFAQDFGTDLEVPSDRSSPHVADLDGDGEKDLLTGNTNGEILVYPNTGTDASPSFTGYWRVYAGGVPIDLPDAARSRPFVCDWDDDGLDDILAGGADGLVRLYLGLGPWVGVQGDTDRGGWAPRLLPARPNPFALTTSISFELRARARVEISVYDIAGRHVSRLTDREFGAGKHEVAWHGRRDSGDRLPAGVYLVRMATRAGSELRKIVLVR